MLTSVSAALFSKLAADLLLFLTFFLVGDLLLSFLSRLPPRLREWDRLLIDLRLSLPLPPLRGVDLDLDRTGDLDLVFERGDLPLLPLLLLDFLLLSFLERDLDLDLVLVRLLLALFT